MCNKTTICEEIKMWLKKNWIYVVAVLWGVFGLAFMICFACSPAFNDGSCVVDPQLANHYGNLMAGVVGPIFSLISVLIVLQTIKEQRRGFELQVFEGKFFELLRYHRENVNCMKMRDPAQSEEFYIEGQQCFRHMYDHFKEIFEMIGMQFQNNIEKLNKDREEEWKITLAYAILFWGVAKNYREDLKGYIRDAGREIFFEEPIQVVESKKKHTIKKKLCKKIVKTITKEKDKEDGNNGNLLKENCFNDFEYKRNVYNGLVEDRLLDTIINIFREKKANYRYNNHEIVYYGGHQVRLGHYFRNLCNIMQFIDGAKILSKEEKREYANMLRNQMSQYELAILFYQAFSIDGKIWKDWIVNYSLLSSLSECFLPGNINPKKYLTYWSRIKTFIGHQRF